VSWVKRALAAPLTDCSTPNPNDTDIADTSLEISERLRHELYGKITQEITSILLHEIEPVFGLRRGCPSYPLSQQAILDRAQAWRILHPGGGDLC